MWPHQIQCCLCLLSHCSHIKGSTELSGCSGDHMVLKAENIDMWSFTEKVYQPALENLAVESVV